MSLPVIYSHSRIGTYETCPKQFHFKYILGEEPAFDHTIETYLGDCFHKTMEWLYELPKEERANVTIKQLKKELQKHWNAGINQRIYVVKQHIKKIEYLQKTETMIENFFKKYYPFQENVIGVEVEVSIDLFGDGKYMLRGFIDRLDLKEDGTYEIHDYKTGNTLPTQAKIENDRQLALYSLAVKTLYPAAERIALIWHYVAHDKEFRTEKTVANLEAMKQTIKQTIDNIERTTHFPARPSVLCSWCAYKYKCKEGTDHANNWRR